ncbi:GntR family transcriptional regulator [Lactobacillus pentosus]|jgi:DNA-binding GntR family transcriptional regulator|uniref:GntR family transcriptional regulator n=1 Tax=Lactiplantibacillus pentosus TaxID=1589 RepID=A0A843QQS4_LACPE|nr:GntR family transcriptional regulator [Lactiplantibacillus pentosus]MCH4129820.1 GntR family transcriptional regulator [Lactiplantibacillus sp.]BBM22671.1 transcription regulator, GntR family [Lactiplantibacillus plantarum]ASG80678.1 transcriptional regulator [Lactiplantibacillus pentosus]MCS8602625.1 GntR family transcriptional regulator [Lactiplantibacillus pentosus]MCT3293698.1 GntR family transcriptional regulator [Lactiplantibacillus pentosus]
MTNSKIVPLYQSMLNDLIRQIESGELAENVKLPSEQKLGEKYDVSRITVRRALAELEHKGYIFKKQGQGSFVQTKEDVDLGIHYLDVHKAIQNMNAVPEIKLESFKLIVDGSESDAREVMGLKSDDYLYYFRYMLYADHQPVFHEQIYLPFDRFPRIYNSEIANNELMPFLVKKYGLHASFFSHTKPSLITKDNRKEFGLNVGDPMIYMHTRGIEQKETIYYRKAAVVGNLIMYIVG